MPLRLASLVNLNGPGRYIHWGFIQLSLANLLVIATMLVVFVLALLVPFPRTARHHQASQPESTAAEERLVGRNGR
jgi:hypothetical protein